jgi:hypothetical protein
MPIEIIQQRSMGEGRERYHEFSWRDSPGAGFSFPVDENGNPVNVNEASRENWRKCHDGTFDVVDHGVQERTWTYPIPAIGRCHCGREVELSHFTNTCDCGRDYNSSGWELAPRDQWGEETGEHLADILRIP